MVEEAIEGEIKLRFSDDDIIQESKALAKAISGMGDQIESDLDDIGDASNKVQKELEEIGKSAKEGGVKAGKALDQTGDKAKKAATKLKETGTAGKKAGDDVSIGADKGTRAIEKQGVKAEQTENKIRDAGNAGRKAGNDVAAGADKGSQSMNQMATAAGNVDSSMETLSTSMIGAVQAITGVTDAVFGLAASLVGLEKTQFGIKGMEIATKRMEEDLIVAFQEGILTTRELKRMTEDLGLAYEGISLEEKQYAADTLALNGQLVTLGVNTVAAIIQTGISVISIKAMLGVRKAVTIQTTANTVVTGTNTGATALNTVTTGGNTTGIIAKTVATLASTVATVASTIATRAMTTAMLLSPLAPFAIAAIAAGAAFIALNDNIGGVRDSVEDLTGAERGSIPTLGFSITGLGEDMKTTGEETEDFMQNAIDLTKNIQPLTLSIEELAGELTGFSSVMNSFENQIQGAGVISLDTDLNTLISTIKIASENMEKFPARVNLAMKVIDPSIQNTAKQFDLAWGEGTFRKYILNMRRLGQLTREEFNLIGRSVDFTNQKFKDLTDQTTSNLKSTTNSLNDLALGYGKTSDAIIRFQQQLEGEGIRDLEDRSVALTALFKSVKLDGIDTLSPAFKLAKEEIMPELTEIALGLNNAFGAEKANEYLTSLEQFGVIGSAAFDKIKNTINDVNKSIDESKKNFEQLDDFKRELAKLKSDTNAFFGLEGEFNTQSILDIFNARNDTAFNLQTNAVATNLRLSQAKTKRNSFEGMAIIALQNGSFDRTQDSKTKNNSSFWSMVSTIRAATGLPEGVGVSMLMNGMSLSKVYGLALQSLEAEAIRAEERRLKIIADRAQTVSLLSQRLNTSAQDLSTFTQTEAALSGFIDPVLAATTGISHNQIQDFLTTESGRRDLANRILLAQRDVLISLLV